MTCRVSLAAVTGGGKRRRYGHLPNRGQFLEASSKMLLVLACAATRALSFKIKPAPNRLLQLRPHPGYRIGIRQPVQRMAFTSHRGRVHATRRNTRHPEWLPAVALKIESLARAYERPALRKPFAAFPADTKVA
jgi:hypothetical protein